MKRLILGCAVLALMGGAAGEAKAGVISDSVNFFVGGTNVGGFTVPESSSEGSSLSLTVLNPIVIELLEPGTQIISDVLRISSLSLTFTSDGDLAPPLPANPDAFQVGEIVTALDVRVQSDLDEPWTAPANSDVLQFFSAGNSPGSIKIAEDPTRPEIRTFRIGLPVTFDMLEADGTVSDELVISQFSGSFTSDGDPSTITHTDGAFQLDETGSLQSLFRMDVNSDSAVPEPGSLTLLGMAVVGMAGYRWRRRKQIT